MPGASAAIGWGLACVGGFVIWEAYRGVNPVKDLEAIIGKTTRPTASLAAFTIPGLGGGAAGAPGGGAQTVGYSFPLSGGTLVHAGSSPAGDPTGKRAQICAFALSKVGGQYVWGGNGPSSYDCSGLFYAAYRSAGVVVTRLSGTESLECTATSSPQPGDAVFYGHPADHVGIYLGNGQMVAADHPDAGGPGHGILHEAVYPNNGGPGGPAVWYGYMNALRIAEKGA